MTTTAYQDHPVRTSLAKLHALEADPVFADPVLADNEQHAFARDKTFSLAKVLSHLLDATPALYVSQPALGTIEQHVQTAFNELTAYLQNKNPQHLLNAASQFEQHILPQLWAFAPRIPATETEVPAQILDEWFKSARETIRQLTSERDVLAEKLNANAAQAGELQTKLTSMADVALKERAEAAATIAKLEQAFAVKEAERSTAFEATLSKARADHQAQEEATKKQASDLLAHLEQLKEQAAKIVQVVGAIGVTGKFQTTANNEGNQANFWRWVTVAFFATGVVLALLSLYRHWHEPITSENLGSIAIRLLYALAITTPGWYTARESARHRTNSDRARQTELELASLGPFIELLPEPKKMEITEQMTKIYFGREVSAHTTKGMVDVSAIKEVGIEIAKALKK